MQYLIIYGYNGTARWGFVPNLCITTISQSGHSAAIFGNCPPGGRTVNFQVELRFGLVRDGVVSPGAPHNTNYFLDQFNIGLNIDISKNDFNEEPLHRQLKFLKYFLIKQFYLPILSLIKYL